jgi:hypothetical protein
MDKDIQSKLIEMKRAVRDLKTAHNMKSIMRTWHLAITLPAYQSYNTIKIRAVYDEGTQPIMTAITGDRHLIPLEPVGNTQDFILAEKQGTYQPGMNVYFLSTRRILSLTII